MKKQILILFALLLISVIQQASAVYDPSVGRWLSRDPLNNAELRIGPNLYNYVVNNPANLFDLLGLRDFNSQSEEDLRQGGSLNPGLDRYNRDSAQLATAITQALNQLGENDSASPYSPDFSKSNSFSCPNNNWKSATSIHGTSSESPSIPNSPYVLKNYNDPQRGNNIMAITHPTASFSHYMDAADWMLGGHPNTRNADDYLDQLWNRQRNQNGCHQ